MWHSRENSKLSYQDFVAMTTKKVRGEPGSTLAPDASRAFALILILAGATLLPFAAFGQKQSRTTTEDLPPGAMQAKATTACLECHEARIILQQRLSKAAWTKEVDKMVKWGALVDGADRDPLIDYLSTNFNPDQPPYAPPRSSSQKSATSRKPK